MIFDCVNRIGDTFVKKLESWKWRLEARLHNSDSKGRDNNSYLKSKNWENVWRIWDNYASPFRPSAGDIKNYEKILNGIAKKDKILILGSTPELRDIIVLKYPASSLFLADFSFSMLRQMLRFLRYDFGIEEKWIKADWLSLDEFLKNDYFDVILGDLVLRNIEPELQDKFLSKIKNLLAPGGFFIERTHFINEDLLKSSPGAVIRGTLDDYFGCSDILLEDLIASRLFDKKTDFSVKKINKADFSADTDNYLQKSAKNEKEKLILRNILRKWGGKNVWTQRTNEEIENLFNKHFLIRDLRTASDYSDAKFYPIYTLKKK